MRDNPSLYFIYWRRIDLTNATFKREKMSAKHLPPQKNKLHIFLQSSQSCQPEAIHCVCHFAWIHDHFFFFFSPRPVTFTLVQIMWWGKSNIYKDATQPSIFCLFYTQGYRGGENYPSFVGSKSALHPGQDACLLQGHERRQTSIRLKPTTKLQSPLLF